MIFSHENGHEQVVFCHDSESGLKAIVGIYSTALGPALGGTRFYPYASEHDALADVLNLSRGMAYKNALAGLDLGGGKAVIIGDPAVDKSERLLRAYGRFVATLAGRYITACDVGTFVEDMDIVADECQWVTGRSPKNGGAGDSSVLTAYGVIQGMRASAQWLWGAPTLQGRRVGVAGVGKVGRHLTAHLVEAGAEVTVADVDERAISLVQHTHPGVHVLSTVADLVEADLDIYAPCALGGALDEGTVGRLKAQVVCGAANNQLAHDGIPALLQERGILYAPDYLVNAGGVIQVDDERHGFVFDRAKAKAAEIFNTTLAVYAMAAEQGLSPAVAADSLAEQRMAEAVRLRTVAAST